MWEITEGDTKFCYTLKLVLPEEYEVSKCRNLSMQVLFTSSRVSEWRRPLPGKFLGIVGRDLSDSKSSWLHVDIIVFCFIHSNTPRMNIVSFKVTSNYLEVFNFDRLFLKLNRFMCE